MICRCDRENSTAPPQRNRPVVTHRDITPYNLKTISQFLPDYLSRSLEFNRSSDDVINEISSGMNDEFKSLWIIFNKKSERCGFGFCQVMFSEYGNKIVNIHHLFISDNDRELIHEFDHKVGEWGKKLGATEVGFYTRRNPSAFLRRIKNGWDFDSYILKRKI